MRTMCVSSWKNSRVKLKNMTPLSQNMRKASFSSLKCFRPVHTYSCNGDRVKHQRKVATLWHVYQILTKLIVQYRGHTFLYIFYAIRQTDLHLRIDILYSSGWNVVTKLFPGCEKARCYDAMYWGSSASVTSNHYSYNHKQIARKSFYKQMVTK